MQSAPSKIRYTRTVAPSSSPDALFIGRWIRSQHPLPAAIGELIR